MRFKVALEYTIRGFRKPGGLIQNGTLQLLVCADYVNILGRSMHTIKKNKEALVVGSKENELEVNVDKTKYMVMARDQNT